MNRKQKMSIAVISVGIVLLASTCVTANSVASNTPLFTIRMEQHSSEMHFLSTPVNTFTYTVKAGYILDFDAPVECCNAEPLGNCTDYPTTCDVTCPAVSCYGTCESCSGYTCDDTSCQPTCPAATCFRTCWDTCPILTCYDTCPPCLP